MANKKDRNLIYCITYDIGNKKNYIKDENGSIRVFTYNEAIEFVKGKEYLQLEPAKINFKVGDQVKIEIYGVGEGICEVVSKDNELYLFEEIQGYLPLSEAINRKDVTLTKL